MRRLLKIVIALLLEHALFCNTTMYSPLAVDAFSITGPSRRLSSTCRILRMAHKRQNANEMALKIGLNVVPPRRKESNKSKNTNENKSDGGSTQKKMKKERKSKYAAPPRITWGSDMERFFWPTRSTLRESSKEKSDTKGFILEDSRISTNTPMYHRIPNKESFPLIHIPGALSVEALAWVLTMATCDSLSDMEELEQHDWIDKSKEVHTLRRSLVSQLSKGGNLLDGILSKLPVELVGDQQQQQHPYEDGSLVYYRTGLDFYDEHHDSYDPGDGTLRSRQRAFTILLYLRTPSGPLSAGGTEFTRLTPLLTTEDGETCCIVEGNTDGSRGLIVRPSAGDALIWPNFDRDGAPYQDSLHRALPVPVDVVAATGRKGSDTRISSATNEKGPRIEKMVINLWFEGMTKGV